ncbi:MAG TPA: nitroreductase/quinone reductase family protein [Pseudonocardiaceae bacterium]|jgi:deazaflavin-dependent oxidoreductase (nitroreductase family)|nr:nitroreductase/quinone reductase family protein [Pseudonocardiaceae bacterium]
MSFEKTPSGTKGARSPGKANAVTRFVQRMMIKQHRRKGDRFMGMDVLYLTTVGARTGRTLVTPLAYLHDGDDGWFVVASAGGAAKHPSWYHNLAAHPDQVSIEIGGEQVAVTPTQLEGQERADVWRRITSTHQRFAGYQKKTDRVLPVLRLARS